MVIQKTIERLIQKQWITVSEKNLVFHFQPEFIEQKIKKIIEFVITNQPKTLNSLKNTVCSQWSILDLNGIQRYTSEQAEKILQQLQENKQVFILDTKLFYTQEDWQAAQQALQHVPTPSAPSNKDDEAQWSKIISALKSMKNKGILPKNIKSLQNVIKSHYNQNNELSNQALQYLYSHLYISDNNGKVVYNSKKL